MLLVSRSGVPSGKQCLISILSCFQVVFFLFACLCSYDTDVLTLVYSCHDLVYFCSFRIFFSPVEVECSLFYMNMV